MSYSRGYDQLLLTIGTHQVLCDKYQWALQHPTTCPGKGARLDRYKTFHSLPRLSAKLEACGLSVTPLEWEVIRHRQSVPPVKGIEAPKDAEVIMSPTT